MKPTLERLNAYEQHIREHHLVKSLPGYARSRELDPGIFGFYTDYERHLCRMIRLKIVDPKKYQKRYGDDADPNPDKQSLENAAQTQTV